MPITNVNPGVPLVLPDYVPAASLTANLPVLKKRLHRKIFVHELNASKYTVNISANGIEIKFSGSNEDEQTTINKVSQRSKVLSEAIADEILDWLKASQQNLQVKVNHGATATDFPSLLAAHNADPNMGQKYWIIEGGGNSVPKGFKV